MEAKKLGLRERKRRETRTAIQKATIELTIRDGLDHTTIEAISERAAISPRTFFNYFDSKEDALLGMDDLSLSDDAVRDCLAKAPGDLVDGITTLLVEIIGPSLTDPALHTLRRQIMSEHPLLLERHAGRVIRTNRQIVNTLERVVPTNVTSQDIEITLALCSNALRFAIREWVATNQPVSLTTLHQRTKQIINEVLIKIS